jgi:hypothetical protein
MLNEVLRGGVRQRVQGPGTAGEGDMTLKRPERVLNGVLPNTVIHT